MLVDTHCHLDFLQFSPDRDLVLARARAAGVLRFINIGATLDSSSASCLLAREHEDVYASVGVHPHDAESFDWEILEKLKQLASGKKVVAIGETGLDFYRNLSSRAKQREAFTQQIKLAQNLGLPLVVHSRQAAAETIEILKAAGDIRAVIHCFSGDKNFLEQCLDLGCYISYTCNITYKKSLDLRAVLKITPLEKLMLETDAPYLSPEGFRTQRNEPAQIKLLAQEVSEILGVNFDKIAQQTTQNALNFFKIK